MVTDEMDPAYRNALREAFVVVAIYTAALVYTITYCWIFGYGREPIEVVTYAGIPDWVLWGVFVPWGLCIVITLWFCFFYMADDDLEPAAGDEVDAVPSVETGGSSAP